MQHSDIQLLRGRWPLGLEEFVRLRSTTGDFGLVRWDNYIDPVAVLRPNLQEAHLTAHQDHPGLCESLHDRGGVYPYSMESFFENLEQILDSCSGRVLFNLDLDYFFLDAPWGSARAFTDDFIRGLVEYAALRLGKSAVWTIAWSPECCGRWVEAAGACRVVCDALGIECPISNESLSLRLGNGQR